MKYFKNETQIEKSLKRFFSRRLISKLQQKVLQFNNIRVSWSSPKTGLHTNTSNFENRSYENVSFSQ